MIQKLSPHLNLQMPENKFILRRPFPYVYRRYAFLIILVNFCIFGLQFLYPDLYKTVFSYSVMRPVAVSNYHMYWQFITYMFMHYDFRHVLFNMLALLIFGSGLEKAVGSREFLLFYLLCGVLSGFLSFLVYKFTGQDYVYLLGASGAVYAVLFAYAVVFPRSVFLVWWVVPVPAPVMVFIYALVELGSQFLGRNANVAHMTHLFGFLAAWLYFVLRMGIHPIKIWKDTYRR